ncbi:Methyltransferase-like protein 7A [Orchesella cincta]|uniref:Methyltransferase-like protein 7A n=1 Tax=Orchesella cincta TaxID=48709 RepID=A0A1D2MIX5_ORCCI|nr:Methyltransferase-like protein 7A [Orchesella cincta]
MKEIPSQSVDAVVSTLVLCSADGLQKTFKEIQRVLVPGGKFFFMEHVIDTSLSAIKIAQIIFGSLGIAQFLLDGCRPDKDIKKELEIGGFASVDVRRFRLDLKELPLAHSGTYLIQPHIYGTATTFK